jgi:hypothetical protein
MICHAWRYGGDYDNLVSLLNAAPNFSWRNFSVPEDDPIHSSSEARIRAALDEQVRRSQVVLMLGGVYATHSDWMQKEVDIAQSYRKPIVGLKPHGNERMSTIVQDAAAEVVNWSTVSIVDAIRRHAL